MVLFLRLPPSADKLVLRGLLFSHFRGKIAQKHGLCGLLLLAYLGSLRCLVCGCGSRERRFTVFVEWRLEPDARCRRLIQLLSLVIAFLKITHHCMCRQICVQKAIAD